MGVSLVIDDTTLALLTVLIGALALNIYTARASTPLLHPLLLARQAEVATVRQPNESAVYRNSNSPSGFDLAARPRREIVDVRSLIQLGATGSEIEHDRRLLGYRATTSNRQVLNHVQALAHAISSGQPQTESGGEAVTTLFIAGVAETPSYAILVALLAATARGTNGSIQTVVLPPTSSSYSISSALRDLPAAVVRPARLGGIALLAGPEELDKLQPGDLQTLCSLPASSSPLTVIIDDTAPDFFSSSSVAPVSEARMLRFTELIKDSGSGSTSEVATADPDPPLQRASKLVAWFPATPPATSAMIVNWIPASNAVLVAGVTAHLSLFPADKIPNRSDEILLALLPPSSSKIPGEDSLTLAHPAGLALALTALYTGAALRIQSLPSLRTETNEMNISPLVSLLFLPSALAPQLAHDLAKNQQSRETSWKGDLLFGPWGRRSAMRTLRCGSLPPARKPVLHHGSATSSGGEGMWITASTPPSYSAPASLGLGHLRSVICLTSEDAHAVEQDTLDTLRLEGGCAVWQVYLPVRALRVRPTETAAGAEMPDQNQVQDRQGGWYALVAAPITAAHSLDLQAFAPFETGSTTKALIKGTHVGAPSVSLEVKLAEVVEASGEGRAGDLEGEIVLRGKTVALYAPSPPLPPTGPVGGVGAGVTGAAASPPRPFAAPPSAYWFGTAQRGSWRSNGTLVLLP
ncbi:unnamed protein product [Tilletia controversa]|uniref:AMP-dependent synthetase/ligase domain-containing protein n=2 Tax=Tilletia TaxID=13289 RepID=A0A177U3D1_9BASI|nr:hypothetical protein CF336_g7082 [Tilletia laevis]KAE8187464.1 hypothetical protein CF328_g6907 [Tilletia controversa]KAE8250279.1 hypothetical protein A4X03_0g6473 [Tilletia caries]CAD6891194.1 unnamed protein product [Tilletia caries]CAD6899041.1 unnamed protein product [Tilletia laevis]